jgi:AraC family transcriptional regulator of adaptative response/methylated-DNA-[protein]-cysteine methyltransferase
MIITSSQINAEDYARIEAAIQYLEKNAHHQPDLREVAQAVNLSEYHFQRLFTRWVGISPKKFLQYLTKENAKQLLEKSASLLEATYESGLSSPGRLHDLFVTYEAVTPGEYKQRGENLTIQYAFCPSPFGECLLGVTERGICHLAFLSIDTHQEALQNLQARWPKASLQENNEAVLPLAERIFSDSAQTTHLPIHLNGTNFQLKVWEALLQIPSGTIVSYEGIATTLGMPGAARAVGNALARNPIAYLIPCHRVIRKTGDFGSYQYGHTRKKAILGYEMAGAYES